MPPSAIHVIGIDPGATTGWCRLTVPRKCIFGYQDSEILEWEHGEITGPEADQALELARIAVVTQSMDYKVGPALVIEDFDIMQTNPTTNRELLSPVRIAAMLWMLAKLGKVGDSRIVLQGRTIAKQTMTDDRLKAFGLYTTGSDHVRDATRHAVTALRRSRQDWDFRDELWNAHACTI